MYQAKKVLVLQEPFSAGSENTMRIIKRNTTVDSIIKIYRSNVFPVSL